MLPSAIGGPVSARKLGFDQSFSLYIELGPRP
jgi:hypothetical protein